MFSDYAAPKIHTESVLATSGWKCGMRIFKCIMMPVMRIKNTVSCKGAFISEKNVFYKIWIIYMPAQQPITKL